MLYDEGTKRAFWKLAVVNEVLQGSDDRPRAAVIRVGSSDGPTKVLRRSIQYLIPIEVTQEDDVSKESSTEDAPVSDVIESPSNSEINTTEDSLRPHRHAAIEEEALRRLWTQNS